MYIYIHVYIHAEARNSHETSWELPSGAYRARSKETELISWTLLSCTGEQKDMKKGKRDYIRISMRWPISYGKDDAQWVRYICTNNLTRDLIIMLECDVIWCIVDRPLSMLSKLSLFFFRMRTVKKIRISGLCLI